MKITRELLREWGACYTDGRIAEIVPDGGLTPLQILDLNIPTDDRLWVVLRESVISQRELRLLACKWAREALEIVGNPDPLSVAAVNCAERFARGEATAEELAAASAAASDAAWAAARDAARVAARVAAQGAASAAASDAAWAAARDAARVAARVAAQGAAWAAAWYAAQDAAWDAAWDAARDTQIVDARAVLTELEE